jgi:3',5'-cyclic AMP phosphodiesterase CpdA
VDSKNLIAIASKPLFRIAHLSDTHVSPEFNRRNILKLKTLLSHIVDENYDHVAITGDITEEGEERDFRSVRRMLKYYGLLKYDKLTVTIGNHDIFGGIGRAEDILTTGKRFRSVNYSHKISLFEAFFRETFPIKAYKNERVFPFVKVIGPVVFVGINSVMPFHPLLNPFGSNGNVSKRQLQAIEKILGHPSIASLVKIALIHHHFNKYNPYSSSLTKKLFHLFEAYTLELHNKRKIQDTFKRFHIDLVLHGHTHLEEIYSDRTITYSSTAISPIRKKGENIKPFPTSMLNFNEIAVSENGVVSVRRHQIPFTQKRSAKSKKTFLQREQSIKTALHRENYFLSRDGLDIRN